MTTTVYDFIVKDANGEEFSLEAYRGKPLLIVNTASKCGFTNQFDGLQTLYQDFKEKGFIVLGFPSDNFQNQEFDDIEETVSFCRKNYGVEFPMFAKIDVKGPKASPLFSFLTSQKKGLLTEGVKWNFTKFLVNPKGEVVERFAPQTAPEKIRKSIEKLFSE